MTELSTQAQHRRVLGHISGAAGIRITPAIPQEAGWNPGPLHNWARLVESYLDEGHDLNLEPAPIIATAEHLLWHLNERPSEATQHKHLVGRMITDLTATLLRCASRTGGRAPTRDVLATTSFAVLQRLPRNDPRHGCVIGTMGRAAIDLIEWRVHLAGNAGLGNGHFHDLYRTSGWTLLEDIGFTNDSPDWTIELGDAWANLAHEVFEDDTLAQFTFRLQAWLAPYLDAAATGECTDPELGALLAIKRLNEGSWEVIGGEPLQNHLTAAYQLFTSI